MTTSRHAGRPAPTDPTASTPWRQVAPAGDAFCCGWLHYPGSGRVDESARRLSHEEYAVARLLAGEGHDVRSLPESRRGGRRPDLLVCGTTVEVKSFAPVAERRRMPTPQSVFNKLMDAGGQASHVVLVAGGSGLSAVTARRGLARYAADRRERPVLASVRVVGDGYDLAWSRPAGVEVGRPVRIAPARRPERGLGL